MNTKCAKLCLNVILMGVVLNGFEKKTRVNLFPPDRKQIEEVPA